MSRCLTIQEAADYLGVNHKTLRRMIDRGELPALRVGRVFRIEEDALREALQVEPSSVSPIADTPPRPRRPRGRFAEKARRS